LTGGSAMIVSPRVSIGSSPHALSAHHQVASRPTTIPAPPVDPNRIGFHPFTSSRDPKAIIHTERPARLQPEPRQAPWIKACPPKHPTAAAEPSASHQFSGFRPPVLRARAFRRKPVAPFTPTRNS
jgi:hypothetical protein